MKSESDSRARVGSPMLVISLSGEEAAELNKDKTQHQI
jgi:hypothetical protein